MQTTLNPELKSSISTIIKIIDEILDKCELLGDNYKEIQDRFSTMQKDTETILKNLA